MGTVNLAIPFWDDVSLKSCCKCIYIRLAVMMMMMMVVVVVVVKVMISDSVGLCEQIGTIAILNSMVYHENDQNLLIPALVPRRKS